MALESAIGAEPLSEACLPSRVRNARQLSGTALRQEHAAEVGDERRAAAENKQGVELCDLKSLNDCSTRKE